MKRLLFLAVLALPLFGGCDVFRGEEDFSWTPCNKGLNTKSDTSDEFAYPGQTLTLCAQDGKLAIQVRNKLIGCGEYDLTPSVRVEGKNIYCTIRVDYTGMANCICHLDLVQNLVSGLRSGEEYTLYYEFGGEMLNPIGFKYSSQLNVTLDFEQNRYIPAARN